MTTMNHTNGESGLETDISKAPPLAQTNNLTYLLFLSHEVG